MESLGRIYGFKGVGGLGSRPGWYEMERMVEEEQSDGRGSI
jgi:hypothetical protein